MVVHDLSIINVNETQKEKEAMFSRNKAVFYIHLPQLIGCRNLAIIGKLTRMFTLLRSLGL